MEPLDSVKYWSAPLAPTLAGVPPSIPSGGILGNFGQENRGILGNLGQADGGLPIDQFAMRLPFRTPTEPIPIDSLAMRLPLKLPIAPVPIENLLLPAQQPWDDASSYNSSRPMRDSSTVPRAPAWDTVST